MGIYILNCELKVRYINNELLFISTPQNKAFALISIEQIVFNL